MQAVTLPPPQSFFSLRGTCPHCQLKAVFLICQGASPGQNAMHQADRVALAVMQCQGCLQFILGSAVLGENGLWIYRQHYPLGKPNDEMAPEIPTHIADDFKEALRCQFVKAYNATVEMCRRAVQACCLDRNAPAGKKLVYQIDWLAEQEIITAPLKEMAHRVRLGGNLGAHPPEDPNDPAVIVINEDYANAVVEFTRELFDHVYVMPGRLSKYTFKTK